MHPLAVDAGAGRPAGDRGGRHRLWSRHPASAVAPRPPNTPLAWPPQPQAGRAALRAGLANFLREGVIQAGATLAGDAATAALRRGAAPRGFGVGLAVVAVASLAPPLVRAGTLAGAALAPRDLRERASIAALVCGAAMATTLLALWLSADDDDGLRTFGALFLGGLLERALRDFTSHATKGLVPSLRVRHANGQALAPREQLALDLRVATRCAGPTGLYNLGREFAPPALPPALAAGLVEGLRALGTCLAQARVARQDGLRLECAPGGGAMRLAANLRQADAIADATTIRVAAGVGTDLMDVALERARTPREASVLHVLKAMLRMAQEFRGVTAAAGLLGEDEAFAAPAGAPSEAGTDTGLPEVVREDLRPDLLPPWPIYLGDLSGVIYDAEPPPLPGQLA